MKCQKCGNEINSLLCPYCGYDNFNTLNNQNPNMQNQYNNMNNNYSNAAMNNASDMNNNMYYNDGNQNYNNMNNMNNMNPNMNMPQNQYNGMNNMNGMNNAYGNNMQSMQSMNEMQGMQQMPQMQPMQQMPQMQPMQQMPQMQPMQPAPKKKKSPALVFLILITIIVLILVCLFIVLPKVSDEYKTTMKELLGEPTENKEPINPKPSEDIDREPGTENKSNVTRTFMIYLIGSNLETDDSQGTLDLEEMLAAKGDDEDVRVLVYTGGTKIWKNDYISPDENAIYEINNHKINKVKSLPIKSMVREENLTEFMDYVYDNYKTDEYSLILWDHGGGPLFGYGTDEFDPKEILSISEINSSLQNSKLIKNKKLEFLGFDACLMSSLEIANTFKEEANYFIASAENEPGNGWNYEFLKDVNKKSSSEEIGTNIVNKYYDFYSKGSFKPGYYYKPTLTLSLIDLSKITKLTNDIDNLFKKVNSSDNKTMVNILRSANNSLQYGYSPANDTYNDLVDIEDFINNIHGFKEEKEAIKKSLDDVTVKFKSNKSNSKGLSMYFPVVSYMNYEKIETLTGYNNIIVSENYHQFLKRLQAFAQSLAPVKSNIGGVKPISKENNKIEAVLPKELVDNHTKITYIIFRKIKSDGSYQPVYLGRDVKVEDDKISVIASNKNLTVKDNKGERGDLIAFESSRNDKEIVYETSAVLNKYGEIKDFKTEAVDLTIVVDIKTGEGKIVDIKKLNSSENNQSGKKTYDLNDWDSISFISRSYMLYDKDGKKLPDWEPTKTIYGTEITIKDGINIKLEGLDPKEEYYYAFKIKDTQGKVHETDLLKAK